MTGRNARMSAARAFAHSRIRAFAHSSILNSVVVMPTRPMRVPVAHFIRRASTD